MMQSTEAAAVCECLASSVRLDVFRLLVKHAPQGLVAGEIGRTLEIAPTNLSFHLKALAQSGLCAVTQEGRFLRYRANLGLMGDWIAFLMAECCQGSGCAAATLPPTDCHTPS